MPKKVRILLLVLQLKYISKNKCTMFEICKEKRHRENLTKVPLVKLPFYKFQLFSLTPKNISPKVKHISLF